MSLLQLFTIIYIHFYHVSTISQNSWGGQQFNLEQDQINFYPSLSNSGPGYFLYPKIFHCFPLTIYLFLCSLDRCWYILTNKGNKDILKFFNSCVNVALYWHSFTNYALSVHWLMSQSRIKGCSHTPTKGLAEACKLWGCSSLIAKEMVF